ncbi:hypothetical protein BJ741DRAFT_593038 [Chytriomyces cf. hyalinus JEL632]|nr:hypothetical protein BJ741DRAFT_593038 [Chytriomyces cf. hyalinus JEL632]
MSSVASQPGAALTLPSVTTTTALVTSTVNTITTTSATAVSNARVFSVEGFPFPYNYPTWPPPAGVVWPPDYPFPPPPPYPGAEWRQGDPNGFFPPGAPVPPAWPKGYPWPPARGSSTSAPPSSSSSSANTSVASRPAQTGQPNASMSNTAKAIGTAAATGVTTTTLPNQDSQNQKSGSGITSDDTIIIASVSAAVVAVLIAAGVLYWLRKRYITLGDRVRKVNQEQADGIDTHVVMLPPHYEAAAAGSGDIGHGGDAAHFLTSSDSPNATIAGHAIQVNGAGGISPAGNSPRPGK